MVRKVSEPWFFFIVILASTTFFSCTDGYTSTLLRSYADPFTEIPTVVSSETENTISVSWSNDPGTDDYILERAEDSSTPVYRTVYRGSSESYTDTGLPSEGRYLYRLVKTRGRKVFNPSLPAFGVSAGVRKDEFENNDSEEKATFLEADCISNMNYYKSYTGAELIDVDWYYVNVPPRRKALVNINEDYNPLAGDETHYRVLIPGRDWDYVIHNTNFEIANPDNVSRVLRFKIYPDPDNFSLIGGAGGQTVTYKITLSQIVQY